jgi:hypothetical protein
MWAFLGGYFRHPACLPLPSPTTNNVQNLGRRKKLNTQPLPLLLLLLSPPPPATTSRCRHTVIVVVFVIFFVVIVSIVIIVFIFVAIVAVVVVIVSVAIILLSLLLTITFLIAHHPCHHCSCCSLHCLCLHLRVTLVAIAITFCWVKGLAPQDRVSCRNLCEVMVSKAKVEVTSFEKLKLWAVEKLKNQSIKSMRARGRKFGVKTRPKIFLAQNLIFFNGSTAFQFPRNPRKSSSTAFRFLHWLSDFFNGFPISSTAFRFLQRLSNFSNGFLLAIYLYLE